jgi:SAM-dependent methyltransferase
VDDDSDRAGAEHLRSLIASSARDPSAFRAALAHIPPRARDACVDRALAIGPIPDDGPELPRGCVPYLPCAVDPLLRLVEHARVQASDVFVDVGSGLGRAAALVHLMTGARAIGLEIQPALVAAARDLTARLRLPDVTFVEGDAVQSTALSQGSVFLLYCPFGGERLEATLATLASIARTRTIRVCCVDLPLPPRAWLTPLPPQAPDLTIYRSKLAGTGR